ncbi:MAG: hypothetical protein PQ612_10535 [Rickettsiales bacterium]|nr:hypothetical protein [Rickettsiales bacterium]MDG4548713.1 hypothetical protein [Rickettsiales bacterium]
MSYIRIFMLSVLIAFTAVTAFADDKTDLTISFHAVVDSPEPDGLFYYIEDAKETIFVRKVPVIGSKDIASIERTDKSINVKFTEAGDKMFFDFTKANLNKRMAIIINSKIVMAPVIRSPIMGGGALLPASVIKKEEAMQESPTLMPSVNIYNMLKTGLAPVWAFLNSTLFISLISTLVAAFAGAFGAQVIIERSKNKDRIIKDIRNINSTIMLSFGICNSFLSLKKQYVKSLKENFDKKKEELQKFQENRKVNTSDKNIFEFQADFQTIDPLLIPTDVLQKQAFENMTLNGRPFSLVTTLIQTIHAVNSHINKRNNLIALYHANPPLPNDVLVRIYFGLPDRAGNIDENYPSCIDAIYTHTDDCIQFSSMLCNDLNILGEQLKKDFDKKFGKGAPTVNKPDFSKAEKIGIMPDPKNYKDWEEMFIKAEK